MSASTFLGIDLGTSNSVAMVFDGQHAVAVRTNDGGALLPSVVRIDARGTVSVGTRARKFLETDPENTRSEFKRLMGSERKLAFAAAKLSKSPEELSALVLGALRTFVAQAIGHAPTAAVITVPALFELPQIRATSEAARLAGFERVEHVQEPVASALTAGFDRADDPAPWLVYDLGGGTFDASLLETREGVLRVVGHDGDNFLGGRDMDARLLEHTLAVLAEQVGRPLSRRDPSLAGLLRRLRAACEDAKIELGAGRPATVSLTEPVLVFGEELLVDVPIEPDEFEALVLPVVDRSIDVCLRLLADQGLSPAALGRVVLVGGPTVMPSLRARIEERLGAPLAPDIDPMTAVADGAARFACEHRLGTSMARAPDAKPATSVTPRVPVWLQYPGVSGDLYPFVVGKVDAAKVSEVRLVRTDGAFESAREKIADDGSFAAQVELLPRTLTTLTIVGTDAKGRDVELSPSEVTIRHGLSLADPPLSRSIGVALADDGVLVFFERGAPLPARKTFPLRTSLTVRPGQKESAISVPVVQGEIPLAHLCRLVGTIEIQPEALTEPLVAGTRVDVTLELDRGGALSATAHLPDRGTTFPGTLVLVSPDAPLDQLEGRLAALQARTEALYRDPVIGEPGRKRLVAVDAQLQDAAREAEAASGADPDAMEKLRRLLIDADGALGEIDALRAWPELEERALNAIAFATRWVARNGTATERRTLDETVRSLERARAMRAASEFEKRVRGVWDVGEGAWLRDSHQLTAVFEDVAARRGEMRDPKAARDLEARGRTAAARSDWDAMRSALYGLLDLLPPSEKARAAAHGSGVER